MKSNIISFFSYKRPRTQFDLSVNWPMSTVDQRLNKLDSISISDITYQPSKALAIVGSGKTLYRSLINGRGGYVYHIIWTVGVIFHCPEPKWLHMKFGCNNCNQISYGAILGRGNDNRSVFFFLFFLFFFFFERKYFENTDG